MAFTQFWWGMIWLVRNYGAGFAGISFWAIATTASATFLISYLYMIFLAGRGVVTFMADLSEKAALEGGDR